MGLALVDESWLRGLYDFVFLGLFKSTPFSSSPLVPRCKETFSFFLASSLSHVKNWLSNAACICRNFFLSKVANFTCRTFCSVLCLRRQIHFSKLTKPLNNSYLKQPLHMLKEVNQKVFATKGYLAKIRNFHAKKILRCSHKIAYIFRL